MAGFIVIKNTNIWGPARWVYKRLTNEIIQELKTQGDEELRNIITATKDDYTHWLDLESLSKDNRSKFTNALIRAVENIKNQNGADWHKPEYFKGFRNCVCELEILVNEVEVNADIDFSLKPKYIYQRKKNDI